MNERRKTRYAPWRRSIGLAAALLLTACVLVGCGGGESDEQTGPEAMVPAGSPSSAVADSGLVPADSMAAGMSGDVTTAVIPEPETVEVPVAETSTTPAAPVTEPAVAKAPPPVAAVPSGGAFSLQVGSFRDEANARRLVDRIRAAGHAPAIEEAVVDGVSYHRVVLRGLADRKEAELLGELLRSDLGINYLIRPGD